MRGQWVVHAAQNGFLVKVQWTSGVGRDTTYSSLLPLGTTRVPLFPCCVPWRGIGVAPVAEALSSAQAFMLRLRSMRLLLCRRRFWPGARTPLVWRCFIALVEPKRTQIARRARVGRRCCFRVSPHDILPTLRDASKSFHVVRRHAWAQQRRLTAPFFIILLLVTFRVLSFRIGVRWFCCWPVVSRQNSGRARVATVGQHDEVQLGLLLSCSFCV